MQTGKIPVTVGIAIKQRHAAEATVVILALDRVVLIEFGATLPDKRSCAVKSGSIETGGVGGNIPVNHFKIIQIIIIIR